MNEYVAGVKTQMTGLKYKLPTQRQCPLISLIYVRFKIGQLNSRYPPFIEQPIP